MLQISKVSKQLLASCVLFVFTLVTSHVWAQQKASNSARLNKSSRSAVTVIESVLAGSNVPVLNTFSGAVGPTGTGNSLMPAQSSGASVSLPSVPALPIADGAATKDQLLQSAKTNVMSQANTVATSLKALMASSGHKFGNFIFEQTIKPSGSPTYVKVVWHLAVLDNGRVFYSDPRITDPDPYYVYAVYTSRAVAAGLPASWAYPDGGKFKWQLVKKDGTPMTAMTTVDVMGAFDAPTVTDDVGFDPNLGVKCLADLTSSATCTAPAGFQDLKTLISSTSASGAIIDYLRKLEPAYTDKGDGTKQANMAISFDTRNLTHNNSCTNGTFRTAGRYGFTLNSNYDRFSYNSTIGTPVLMSRSTSNSFSPTQSFDLSQATSSTISGLTNLAINPFEPSGGLVDATTIAGVQYLSPISQDGTSGITKKFVHGNIWGFSAGNHIGDYECFTSNPSKSVWICDSTDSEGSCISGDFHSVQICGDHFSWGYVVGIDRARNLGVQMREYYGGYYFNNYIPVIDQSVPCPN